MEQLIFLAVIVVFSILDSVARSKKKRTGQSGTGAPRTSRPDDREWEDDLPSYDQDPSYDDGYRVETAKRETGPLPRRMEPYRPGGGEGRASPTSSEGMIPSDIWEEIAGLARGRAPAPTPEPAPPPVEVEPVEVEPVPARARRIEPTRPHRVHRSHFGYGTDPSSRRRSEQDGLDPLRATIGRDARAVRRQLTSRNRSTLRRAIILQEVLGPPAATRPDRFPE